MTWTTADLLTRIRLFGRLSSDDPDYTDEVLLLLADDQLRARYSEVISGIRQGHWLQSASLLVEPGTSDYRLPPRALGDAAVDVVLLDSGGRTVTLDGPIPTDELEDYAATGAPEAFAVLDQVIRLLPTPTSAGTLRLRYTLRRSKLVPVAQAALVTAIDVGNNEIATAGLPDSWSIGERYDLIQSKPGFATLAQDQQAIAVGLGFDVLTLSDPIPAEFTEGDYVALRWETPIVQLPDELHGSLANAVAADVLAQIGDTQGAQQRLSLAESQIESAKRMMVSRIRHRPEVLAVVASPLRRGAF